MNVLLVCLGGIAGCVTLVFAVETLVAFFFHEEEASTRHESAEFGVFAGSAAGAPALRKAELDKAA